jgi:cytochrome c556
MCPAKTGSGTRLIHFLHTLCSRSKGAEDMRFLFEPRVVKLGVAALCALASASAVHAQAPDPQQKVVDARQGLFKLVDWSFGPVQDMLRNKAKWDAAVVQKSATRVETLAPFITDAFAVDTHKNTAFKTKARENIWTNAPDFKAKADELAKAAAALAAAAKSGADDKALRQAAMTVGRACSGCHDNYKDK